MFLVCAIAASLLMNLVFSASAVFHVDLWQMIRNSANALEPRHARSKVPPGRWRAIEPQGRTLTARQRKSIRDLESIGYLPGHQTASEHESVTIYNTDLAYNGLNLYASGHGPEAVLMDMEGNVLHRWRYSYKRVWPDYVPPRESYHHHYWRRVHLFDNGDLLAIFEGIGLIKLDKASNLIWDYPGKAHHDLYVTKEGLIYTLTRGARILPEYNREEPILADFIVILDANGLEIKRVSILKCLENSAYAPILQNMKESGDVLHTNTIELLDDRLAHRSPAFREGNVLISILWLNTICVVDLEQESVVWALGEMWKLQHQPTLLNNGNMLIFDNQGRRGNSRVLEFDPFTQQIHWEYPSGEETPLFSAECGSSQRLPNGNTLISESNTGRALEVAPDKRIVWEFVNPHRAGKNNDLIATLFEVVRLGEDFPLHWLGQDANGN